MTNKLQDKNTLHREKATVKRIKIRLSSSFVLIFLINLLSKLNMNNLGVLKKKLSCDFYQITNQEPKRWIDGLHFNITFHSYNDHGYMMPLPNNPETF